MAKVKVTMKTSIAGSSFSYMPKQVVEVEAATAEDWIKRGMAIAGDANEAVKAVNAVTKPVKKTLKAFASKKKG